jgi:hypothetical protein
MLPLRATANETSPFRFQPQTQQDQPAAAATTDASASPSKHGLPPGLVISPDLLPPPSPKAKTSRHRRKATAYIPAVVTGRRQRAALAALVQHLIEDHNAPEELSATNHIPAIYGLSGMVRSLKKEVDQLHFENAQICSDMSLQRAEHRHTLEAKQNEFEAIGRAEQTVRGMGNQLKEAKITIRRMRREIMALKIMGEVSTNSFKSTVARASAEKLVSDAWEERAVARVSADARRAETSYTPMLSELGSKLNDLAPDLALKMELIQAMRRESRNSKVCDEVEEIMWLSIDKVLAGIEEIQTRLADLVLADMDESSIVVSSRDTIEHLKTKVLQQKVTLRRVQARLKEEQAVSGQIRDKLARMKKRNRQQNMDGGKHMRDVVEDVIDRAEDQADMF